MTAVARIGKTYSFDASHQLPNHDGKCANLHGHTYSVTIEIDGAIKKADGSPDEGMVLDYAVLDRIWKEHLEPRLDHRFLNDTIGPDCGPTTAENIAAWVLREVDEKAHLTTRRVAAVTVSETPKTFARIEVPEVLLA